MAKQRFALPVSLSDLETWIRNEKLVEIPKSVTLTRVSMLSISPKPLIHPMLRPCCFAVFEEADDE